ncbi:MAG: phosphoribosylformylglycinamidine synthase subunit PurL [Candidatus Altiarchaeota archaeon]
MYERIAEGVEAFEVKILDADKKTLLKLSRDRMLGLSQDEMVKLQGYFKKEGRNPTDVEVEALAQSWSEHCCYKTSKPILKRTVFSIEAPQNICVISEDAGVVDFDKDHAYVVALESHNHPSALDPYGGAATGIGGILRDVVCMGAQPIALIDPLFFGPLDYKYGKLPEGTKHPKYLLKGVVSGIADYGNRVGIPTVAGMVYFDESYVVNCLVNVGCVGMIRKENIVRSRAGGVGDVYIMAGGKTGRDGIHGVTFASAELTEKSEQESRPAVQLGYAIMKEPLIHACLEANERKLLTGLKDFGGGGLSCVSSEMAHAAGLGATIYLDKVPLKEEGLAPWEIWVSESQERMMFTVKPENVDKVLEIFEFWDVPATVVGKVDNSRRMRVEYKGKILLDLELEFLTAGVMYNRPYKYKRKKVAEKKFSMPKLEKTAKLILADHNVGSKEFIIRRYDHEVRASTILKPMQGVVNSQTHGDAAVLKPLTDSFQGLAITSDVNPTYCKMDPYWGSASAVDEVIRNLVAVGSRPHSMADCLNFGNPEKKERLGDFVKATEGLHYVADYFRIPFVSGNVSLYNESSHGSVAPTPTLLGVGMVDDVRKTVTVDLKENGSLIYLIGKTRRELGGSVYYKIMKARGGAVPKVYPEETKANMEALLKLMADGTIRSCHDLAEGGLFVTLAEMAFGGNLGLRLNLAGMEKLRADVKLFSESNGRWAIEVRKKDADKLEKSLDCRLLGETTSERKFEFTDGKTRLNLDLEELRNIWKRSVEEE